MAKLWEKNYSYDDFVERFTVGEDYILDSRLINADCLASIAHAAMLASIGILTKEEFESLKRELTVVIALNSRGEFPIARSDEDGHTAIENHLTRELGDPGKKIHTGRSRNDQVIAALRLYSRSFLLKLGRACVEFASTLVGFARKHQHTPMPGRTHMQIAMPSSVGLWGGAFAEQILDDITLLRTAYDLNDMSPLGSAASYGVPLPLNREMVADLLGFRKVQNNVLYVNNSRGKIESIILDAVEQVTLSLSKMAQDLILFSMPEFRYFTLPDELCSGSSIMPQKKNPCVLELIRAKSASLSAEAYAVKGIIKALPSGYNRDYQETKGPYLRGLDTGIACVGVMNLIMSKLIVNEDHLRAGFIPEIYATDRALELVSKGMPFRDAYRQVGGNLSQLESMEPVEAIRKKTYTGAPGNLRLELSEEKITETRAWIDLEEKLIAEKTIGLTGSVVEICRT